MQVTYRGPLPAGVAPFLTNAGKASIDGAEARAHLGADGRLAHRRQRRATSMPRSTSCDNIPLAVFPPVCVVGNVLPFAPEWQGHVGVAYDAQIGQLRHHAARRCVLPGHARSSMRRTRARSRSSTTSPTVNASLRLGADGGNVAGDARREQRDGREYPVAGNSSLTTGSGYAEIAYARPREWFANFQYEF